MPPNNIADERGSLLRIIGPFCLVLDDAENRATLPASTNVALTGREQVIGDGSADRVDWRIAL
jgi:hypothetical protein